jgi:hypothetical protein
MSVHFPQQVPRAEKRTAGRTSVLQTPVHLRALGSELDPQTRVHVQQRMARHFGKFALHIERVTVRFRDINGPRGGSDQTCEIKIVVSGRPTVVVKGQAQTPRTAFDRAAARATRALGDELADVSARPESRRQNDGGTGEEEPATPNPAPVRGSLIGRRVGRARANLEVAAARPEKLRRDALVDTTQAGVSASDRKAGGGSTARRNTRLNTAGLTSALEDSAQDRPSRKSTRRSANRAKRDSNLQRRQTRRVHAPKTRAMRSAAKKV